MNDAAPAGESEGRDSLPFWLLGMLLGGASLLGAVTTNILVPAMPVIAADLGATAQDVQFTVVTYLAATAVGQLVYGPFSDRFGRRGPLLFGMSLFLLASIGCAQSGSIAELMIFRTLQGLGACAGFVMSRAIIRDSYTGWRAAQLLSVTMLVSSVGPTVAPIVGGAVLSIARWEFLFWGLSGLSVVVLFITFLWLPESLLSAGRTRQSSFRMLGGYIALLKHRRYMFLAGALALGQAGAFAYLAASAFIFADIFGMDALTYAIVQSGAAAAWVAGVQMAPFAMRELGSEGVIKGGLGAAILASALLFAVGDQASLIIVILLIALDFVGLGLMLSLILTEAMHDFGSSAGSAAAMAGSIQFAAAAGASLLGAILYDGTIGPIGAVMLACSAGAFLLAWAGFRRI